MNKFIIHISTMLVFFIATQLNAQYGKDLDLFDFLDHNKHTIQKSICIIYNGAGGAGTGIIIGKNKILTCRHVTNYPGKIRVAYPDFEMVSDGRVAKDSSESDLCLVTADTPEDALSIKLGSDNIKVGDKIQFLGFAGAKSGHKIPRHFHGRVLSYDKGSSKVLYNCQVIQGDSGGAILNNKNELVGIIQLGTIPILSFIRKGKVDAIMFALTIGTDISTINNFVLKDSSK